MGLTKRISILALAGGFALAGIPAQAATKWDMSIAWPAGNFHTKNAIAFAEEVKQKTGGELDIVVHPGGALGLKGPETLQAVRDGLVPIAEMNMAQQSGTAPFFGLETLPFLVNDYKELKALHALLRPQIAKILEANNQKLLYMVPWPSQLIFTKKPVASLADLAGVKIRTTDRNSTEMSERFGMGPVQMPFSDLMPALASGAVQAVATSASSAVDGKFWEFLTHGYQTNHIWASNLVSVNLDAFKKLPEAQRKVLEDSAKALEPKFWAVSENDDVVGQKALLAKGMKIEPVSAALRAEMAAKTQPMWDAYTGRVAGSKDVLDAYRKQAGR